MMRVPAFRCEFGILVCYHAPAIHALPGEFECETEEGNEALYPRATRHIVVPRASDDMRAGGRHWQGQPVGPDSPKRYFVPEPHVITGITADVVICPRKRTYGAGKNWPHWSALANGLHAQGVKLFVAGAPDSSERIAIPAVEHAWDSLRFLDASIEAIRSARLVIATDAGLAHLAVLCGAPLLLITHHGLTAPGPQLDVRGQAMQRAYPPVRWDRYNGANHTGSPIIECPTGWEEPGDVLTTAMRRIVDADTAAA